MKIIIDIPDEYMHFNFTTDSTTLLRYIQSLYQNSSNGREEYDKIVKDIDGYIKVCKARQSFFILVTENIVHPTQYVETEFLKDDDMEI